MKKHLPKFSTDQEAADWFATHDTSDFMGELDEVHDKIQVQRTRLVKKPVGLRLNPDYLEAIKRAAERKGIPYQTLIQMWLVEKLRQEAPDLLPKPQ